MHRATYALPFVSLILLLPLPGWAAALILLGIATLAGVLLVDLLLASDHIGGSDRFLWGAGAGLALLVWITYALALIPGSLEAWRLAVAFAVLMAGLLVVRRRTGTVSAAPSGRDGAAGPTRSVMALLTVALVAAALLRLWGLGYSELQGDEATPVVRAAAVTQGFFDALFQQRRGPLDVLLPAATMAISSSLSELAMRLPFALAAILAVWAIYRVGSRLSSRSVGALAALLLAIEGYTVAFGRVAHYEVAVLLMALLALDVALAQSRPSTRHWLLVATFVATGLAGHYDGLLVLLPLAVVVWQAGRLHGLRPTLRALLPGALVGVGLLFAFYIPWLLGPGFADASRFYSRTLVAEGLPLVNNGRYFVESAVLYGGAALFWLLAALVGGAAAHLLVRQHRAWAVGGSAIWVIFAGLALAGTAAPWQAAAAGLGLVALVGSPEQRWQERMLWLWLVLPLWLALYVTETPGLHFYIFVPPLLLLAASSGDRLWQWVSQRNWSVKAAVGAAAGAVLVLTFVHHVETFLLPEAPPPVERASAAAPLLWPAPLQTAQMSYGMPHRRGWKATGLLYAEGAIEGAYATNGDEWISDWYTRGAPLCPGDTDLLLLDMTAKSDDAAELIAELAQPAQSHSVRVRGEERLSVWNDGFSGAAQEVDAAAIGPLFDATVAAQPYPVAPRTARPRLHQIGVRFGQQIVLDGASLFREQVRPGETIDLTLRWSALGPIAAHQTLSLQLITPDNRKLAQLDVMPSCDTGPTSDWEVGEEIFGRYRLRVAADAEAGRYPLYALLYDPVTQVRLPASDGSGAALGDMVEIAQVVVTTDE